MNPEVEINIKRIETIKDKGAATVATPDIVKEVVSLLQTVSNPAFKAHLSESRKRIRAALPDILRLCPSLSGNRGRRGLDFEGIRSYLVDCGIRKETIEKRIQTAINSCDNKPTQPTQPTTVR